MLPFLTVLARPLLGRLPVPKAAKEKVAAVNNLLTGGSGDAWIALGRQQWTPSYADSVRSNAASCSRGEVDSDGKSIRWVEFEWPRDQPLGQCVLHNVRWRFYATGLICLELSASKQTGALDPTDQVGHLIELRGAADFLIGVWSAAFLVHKGAEPTTFQSSVLEEHPPLKLHFGEIESEQGGICFRI